MKKLLALFLGLSIMLLTACGNSADESKTETTTTEAAVVTESHTTELYSGVTTIYERPGRMRDDYDSVPTMTFPAPLPEKKEPRLKYAPLKRIRIHMSSKNIMKILWKLKGLTRWNEHDIFSMTLTATARKN